MKCITFLIFGIFLILFSFNFISAVTNVSSCQTLSVDNEIYKLNSSISNNTIVGDCIIINAVNVTLDCDGYSISSIKNFSGVYSNKNYTTIKNCNITMGSLSGGFNNNAIGIEYASGSNGGTIFNNTLNSYVGYGVLINMPDGVNVTKNIASSGSGVAIRLIGSDNSFVVSNIVTSNLNYALGIESSKNNIIIFNFGTSTSYYGINLENLENATISSNNGTSSSGVSSYGIYFIDSNNATFIYNNGTSGSTRGIYSVRATNTNFTSNTGTGIYGMFFNQGSYNNITNNLGIGTTSEGITIQSMNNSSVNFNIGRSLSGSGFYALTNTNNIFNSNIGLSNSSNGFFYQSVLNSISNLDVGISNYSYGIYVYSSSNNIFSNLTALGNFLNADGIVFRSSNNNIIRDTINLTGNRYDVLYITTASINNTFLNCSYNILKESIMVGGELIKKWYYTAYVNDTLGDNISGVNIIIKNVSGVNLFNLTTGIDGITTSYGEIISYINTGGTRAYFSLYNNTASKMPHTALSQSWNVSLMKNSIQNFMLITSNFTSISTLTFNTISPQNYLTAINVSCSSDGDGILTLYRNGINVTSENNSLVILGVGIYNYTCEMANGIIYYGSSDSANYTINKIAPTISITSSSDWNLTSPFSEITGIGCPEQLTCKLHLQGTNISNPYVNIFSVGNYNFTYNTSGNANYTAFSVSNLLISTIFSNDTCCQGTNCSCYIEIANVVWSWDGLISGNILTQISASIWDYFINLINGYEEPTILPDTQIGDEYMSNTLNVTLIVPF